MRVRARVRERGQALNWAAGAGFPAPGRPVGSAGQAGGQRKGGSVSPPHPCHQQPGPASSRPGALEPPGEVLASSALAICQGADSGRASPPVPWAAD